MLTEFEPDEYSDALQAIEEAITRLLDLLVKCDIQAQLQTALVPDIYDNKVMIAKVSLSPKRVASVDKADILRALKSNLLPLERVMSDEGNNRLLGWVEVTASVELERQLFEQFDVIQKAKRQFRQLITDRLPTEAMRRAFYRRHPVIKKYWIKTISRQIHVSTYDIASTTFSWSPVTLSYHPFTDNRDAIQYVKDSNLIEKDDKDTYVDLLEKNNTDKITYVVIKQIMVQPVQSVRWRNSDNQIKRKNLRAHSPLFVINKQVKKSGLVPEKIIDLPKEMNKQKAKFSAHNKDTATSNIHTLLVPGLNIFYRSAGAQVEKYERDKSKEFSR